MGSWVLNQGSVSAIGPLCPATIQINLLYTAELLSAPLESKFKGTSSISLGLPENTPVSVCVCVCVCVYGCVYVCMRVHVCARVWTRAHALLLTHSRLECVCTREGDSLTGSFPPVRAPSHPHSNTSTRPSPSALPSAHFRSATWGAATHFQLYAPRLCCANLQPCMVLPGLT